MPRTLPTPDRLLDRTWRPGHPFRPRLSLLRRFGMSALLIVLLALIGGYWYITDSRRVGTMAQGYLSGLIGGRVEIGHAHLSIFEGLRLDDVRVYVDESNSEDSLLFTASTFLLQYNPLTLLAGRVEATRIIAIDPHVRLTENVDTRQWNYQRRHGRRTGTGEFDAPQTRLPEFLLRNAQIQYSKVRDGRLEPSGVLNVEGQFSPGDDPDHYIFKIQSRGTSALGPSIEGQLKLSSGDLSAQLSGFEFDRDIKALLPEQVRSWWEAHDLSGRVDIPDLFVNVSNPDAPFVLEVALKGVTLTVQPTELMSRQEVRQRRWVTQAFEVMGIAGLNRRGLVDHIASLVQPVPINLEGVEGTFIFTEKGIELKNVEARVEGNTLAIAGRINGYSDDVPFDLRIGSPRNIYLGPSLRYINSMPPGVREVYARFRPVGYASLDFAIQRAMAGGKPTVAGEVNILDAQFAFEKFPYPVRKASGKIRIEHDPLSGVESLKIINLRGQGVEGGPNAASFFEVNGEMGPFVQEIGVRVSVRGSNISSEPALIAAFPPNTRAAMKLFDAQGAGEFPRFRGSFVCDIERYREAVSKWRVQTDVVLDEAAGTPRVFPYPMKGVTAAFTVYDDHLIIKNAQYKKGDATLDVWGRVDWEDNDDDKQPPTTTTARGVKSDLQLHARDVPIDADLLAALPPLQRAWLEKMGAQGLFDLEGAIRTAPGEEDADFEFSVALKDASLWPMNGTAAVSGIRGTLRLTPDKLTLTDLRGKRGESEITTHGSIGWEKEPAQVAIVSEAKNLLLDANLYQLLPDAARAGWDQVRPEGTVDAKITWSGAVQPATGPATAPNGADGFEIVLTARALAATPLAAPYRLEQINGQVIITPRRVQILPITAKHKDATIKLAATGVLTDDAAWDFQLSGENVPVDEDLRKAVPAALADLMKSSELKGTVGFNFEKLHVVPRAREAPADTTPASQPAPPPMNVDFAVTLNARDASLNIGLPLTRLDGVIQLSGSSGNDRLTDLAGSLDIASFLMGDREVKAFRAKLKKYPQKDAMQLYDAQALFAGGELAGQIDWAYPDQGPSRYATNLVLRNADVSQITGEAGPDFRGLLSASLSLEGEFNNTKSRLGRGDVVATGEQMYRIPVLLGLLQVTNLALPIASPFSEATCKYSVDGNKVTFESIELRAKEMMMQGTGNLDFDKMQVRLSFITESTSWLKLPFVGDILQGARNELLQIHVKGSIQQPKVSASSMSTLTTTVDEVMKGPVQQEKKN